MYQKYVRAHFSYDGEIDEQVPCKELALGFSKGEILEISNQDDPDWWQVREGGGREREGGREGGKEREGGEERECFIFICCFRQGKYLMMVESHCPG